MGNAINPMTLWLLPILIILVYLPQGIAFWLFFRHFLFLRRRTGALIAALALFYLAKSILMDNLSPLYSTGMHLTAYFLITISFFYGSMLQKLFFTLYYTTVTLAIEMMALYAGGGLVRLGVLSGVREGALLQVLPFLLVLGGIIAVVGVLRLFKAGSPISLPGKDWGILTLVPAGSLFLMLAGLPGQGNLSDMLQMKLSGSFVAGCAAILIINIAVMLLYQRLITRLQLEQNNLLLQLQIKEYARKLDENRKYERLQHDLKHLVSGLEAFLKGRQRTGSPSPGGFGDAENARNSEAIGTARVAVSAGIAEYTSNTRNTGDDTAAASYLSELIARYTTGGDEQLGFISTGQTVIDSICNEKIGEAARHGIAVEAHAAIPSDLGLTNKEIELALIVGNALDNAVEGVLRLSQDERANAGEPPILLELAYQDGLLFLSLSNAASLTEHSGRDSFLSSKRGGGQPGFGLDSIRYGVERLQGSVAFRYEDARFKMTAVLPMAP
jgi:hypothetical protein